jgi:uncharacterized protein YhbP (UPF0306 family)
MEQSTSPMVGDIIRQYLNDAIMMQLATVADGKPWVCNVWFAVDKNMNIYWFSSTTRRHSKELLENSHVAAAFCLPQLPSDSYSRGLQVEGTAELLTKPSDIATAMKYYVGRVFNVNQIKQFMELIDKPHRFYKLSPKNFVLFDTLNFPENSRQEYTPKDTKKNG